MAIAIQSKGALDFIRVVLNKADEINFQMTTKPETCLFELKKRREALRQARFNYRNSKDLPCGHQDHAYEVFEAANWNFYIYLAAMQIAKGSVPVSLGKCWERATQ